jgi:hypothetical protein
MREVMGADGISEPLQEYCVEDNLSNAGAPNVDRQRSVTLPDI